MDSRTADGYQPISLMMPVPVSHSANLGLASTIAVPSLDTIPGSVSHTPSIHEPEIVPTPPPLSHLPSPLPSRPSTPAPLPPASDQSTVYAPSDYLTPLEGPSSRRSSIAAGSSGMLTTTNQVQGLVGSYFPSPGASRFSMSSPSASPVGTRASTPADRPRPAPIEIPLGTPDEPLFSNYPDHGPSPSESKHRIRSFAFPLKAAFTLAHPPQRRPRREERVEGQQSSASSVESTSRESSLSRLVGRRRATTVTGSPPSMSMLAVLPTPQGHRPPSRISAPHEPASIAQSSGRRRMSIGGHELEGHRWLPMAKEEARRMQTGQPDQLPFSYQHLAESEYTLQSVSTVATIRPLSATPQPHISPRRSSLLTLPNVHGAMHEHGQPFNVQLQTSLGLSNVSLVTPSDRGQLGEPQSDMAMPHEPPPRRSSLGQTGLPRTRLEVKQTTEGDPQASTAPHDHGSVLSATDTSASAEFFSTSPSSKDHPLSSATTSLSRSAKSAKEGAAVLSDEKEAALTAIKLQRSLEWEARQSRHRKRLEKRRMILLELVETEVGYMEDLKTLVLVYLPQLYALPSVSERTADLVARNARDLLDIHIRLANKMVEVLKEEHLGYEPHPEPMVSKQLERVSRRLAALFVEEVTAFTAYNEYCAGSITAATLVRNIAQKPEFSAYERRCQIISASQVHLSLKDLLESPTESAQGAEKSISAPSSPVTHGKMNRTRLHFRDFLIMPIQRICRYPLLLNQLLSAAASPFPEEENEPATYGLEDADGDYDTGVDVERALGAMRGVAEEADEARRLKESETKSEMVLERLEPHPALPSSFLQSLGTCRLIGSLDVLHHHPILAPLVPPVKVKYMAAFLYRGYLILAKVKKGRVYEAKHFLPLEVFELIDITEGFLPHSVRLSLRDHNFDLAASCESEKEVWASALCQARDESTLPPFELPASVSPFAARTRRVSTALSTDFAVPVSPTAKKSPLDSASKRHTVAVSPAELEYPFSQPRVDEPTEYFQTPAPSPSRMSFGFTPDRTGRPGQPLTILLRRASVTQRLSVDRALMDVFSESCSTARSKAQLQHTLFTSDASNRIVEAQPVRNALGMRDSTMLRRRRSFLDSSKQGSIDIAFTGEIRGSVMPVRQSRSLAGERRSLSGLKRFTISGHESSTEVESHGVTGPESADETATGSEFGTLTRGDVSLTASSRTQSFSSITQAYSGMTRQASLGVRKRKSLTNMRRSFIGADAEGMGMTSLASRLNLNRRRTGSTDQDALPSSPSKAKSMPVTPVGTPMTEAPPLPPMPSKRVSSIGGSRSASSSPATGSKALGAAFEGEDVAVWNRGAGLTNRMPERQGTWSTLRRSMSFIRDNGAVTKDGNESGRPVISRHSTDDGFDAASSAVSEPVSLEGDEEDGLSGPGGSGGGSGGSGGGSGKGEGTSEVHAVPRRRKSVRLFQSLSRFTPI